MNNVREISVNVGMKGDQEPAMKVLIYQLDECIKRAADLRSRLYYSANSFSPMVSRETEDERALKSTPVQDGARSTIKQLINRLNAELSDMESIATHLNGIV